MKKKHIIAILTVVLLVLLSACGNTSRSEEVDPQVKVSAAGDEGVKKGGSVDEPSDEQSNVDQEAQETDTSTDIDTVSTEDGTGTETEDEKPVSDTDTDTDTEETIEAIAARGEDTTTEDETITAEGSASAATEGEPTPATEGDTSEVSGENEAVETVYDKVKNPEYGNLKSKNKTLFDYLSKYFEVEQSRDGDEQILSIKPAYFNTAEGKKVLSDFLDSAKGQQWFFDYLDANKVMEDDENKSDNRIEYSKFYQKLMEYTHDDVLATEEEPEPSPQIPIYVFIVGAVLLFVIIMLLVVLFLGDKERKKMVYELQAVKNELTQVKAVGQASPVETTKPIAGGMSSEIKKQFQNSPTTQSAVVPALPTHREQPAVNPGQRPPQQVNNTGKVVNAPQVVTALSVSENSINNASYGVPEKVVLHKLPNANGFYLLLSDGSVDFNQAHYNAYGGNNPNNSSMWRNLFSNTHQVNRVFHIVSERDGIVQTADVAVGKRILSVERAKIAPDGTVIELGTIRME